jgi:hypothetical protein
MKVTSLSYAFVSLAAMRFSFVSLTGLLDVYYNIVCIDDTSIYVYLGIYFDLVLM